MRPSAYFYPAHGISPCKDSGDWCIVLLCLLFNLGPLMTTLCPETSTKCKWLWVRALGLPLGEGSPLLRVGWQQAGSLRTSRGALQVRCRGKGLVVASFNTKAKQNKFPDWTG
jgi:hypothetical protein